jgi:O-antigen ligase
MIVRGWDQGSASPLDRVSALIVMLRRAGLRLCRAARDRVSNLLRPVRPALLAVILGLALSWVGRTVAAGGRPRQGLLALALVIVVVIAGRLVIGRRLKPGFMFVELPVLLLLLSTLVLRRRTSDDLAYNPLDPAAQARVVCVLLAAMLAGTALVSPRLAGSRRRQPLTSVPVRLFMLYVVVVSVGAIISVNPLLTFYRCIELATALAVVAGAYWVAGEDATRRLEAACYWFVVALVASVWIGAAIWPQLALYTPRTSPLPLQVRGVFPALASNGVGGRAVILALWSFARLVARRDTGEPYRSALPLFLVGVVTLVLAQYRSGYVAFVVGMAVVIALRRRGTLLVSAVTVVAVLMWIPTAVQIVQPYALRGQTTERAKELSGRFEWWHDAITVWQRSPVIGRGLLTASRFEVLTETRFQGTSSIHSTWIEALVGTGALGLGFLASSALVALGRARRAALVPGGPVLPLTLLTSILVRSTTGNTLESFTLESLVFLVIAMSMADPPAGSAWPAERQPAARRFSIDRKRVPGGRDCAQPTGSGTPRPLRAASWVR